MVFGEIIEPSTRALIEDDCYGQLKSLEWDQTVQPEKNIETLLVSETKFANKILEVCLLSNLRPVCKTLANEVKIFKRHNDCIILCNVTEGLSIGEIIECILPWLKNSKQIFTLTTAPIATFQNIGSVEHSGTIMRELSTNIPNIYPRLEMPNLVTGVGAGIQSYCVHTNRNCSLFVSYIECEPLDSLNSKPILDLLIKINLTPVKGYELKEKLPSNNLYM